MTQDTHILWQQAREYAKSGIYVFPVYVSRKPDGKKDVRPAGLWRDISSTSLEQIQRWEQQHPDAGLGIDCGKSGLVVVDCDGPEGVSNWDEINETHPVAVVATAGGGQHWYYWAHPDHPIGNDQSGKVANKIDIRGLGGFVIAPPTSDGRGSWEWQAAPMWDFEDRARLMVPPVVIERMKASAALRSSATKPAADADASVDDLFDEPARYFTEEQAKDFIRAARAKLAGTTSGFNGAINNFAMACAHFPWLVNRRQCGAHMIKALGPQTGWTAPDHDDERTIDSAYSATEAGRSWVAVKVESDPREAGEHFAEGADSQDEPEDRWTDAMLSGRLAREELAGNALYTTALGWLLWDGMRWAPSPDEVMHERCRRWILKMYAGAVATYRALPSPDHKLSEDPAVRGWAGAQGANRISSIVKLARGQLLRNAADFDRDPDILNARNGVINLRTGEMMPHDPERLITKVTAVAWHPGAESAALKTALEAVPEDSREWLQRRLGEAATGHSGEQLVLLSGTGRNGKTVLMGASFRALGSYAAKVPNTLLLRARASGGATPERMTLRGVRLAYMEETPEDGYLDATVVKDLLDAEEIEGRHLYRDIVSWKPTHSLFLNTNHPPTMGDTSDASWRRLTRLDFPYRFRKAEEELESPRDRRGQADLKALLSGSQEGQEALLAWIVAGARSYYEIGPEEKTPPSVVAGLDTWREESDDLLRFISQEMVWNPDGWVAKSDMYEAFTCWLKLGGQKSLSVKTFGSRINTHSILAKRLGSGRVERERLSRPASYLINGLVRPMSDRVSAYSGLMFRDMDAPEQEE